MERTIKNIILDIVFRFVCAVFGILFVMYFALEFLEKYKIIKFDYGVLNSKINVFVGLSLLVIFYCSYLCYLQMDKKISSDLRNILNMIAENKFEKTFNTKEFIMLKRAFKSKNEQLEEKDKLLKNSLNFISHDMKTPLTVINTNVNLILSEFDNTDKTNLSRLLKIQNQCDNISDYITTLIDVVNNFSKNSCQEEISVKELIPYIENDVKLYSDLLEEKIDFSVYCINFRKTLKVDLKKLRKSLTHLLNNAYEHKNYTISVNVKVTDKDFSISVIDDGLGFSENALENAKNIFYTDNVGRTSGKGYGLGLYYVESFVNNIDGKLILKNSVRGGAVQTMSIPIKE